MESQFLGLEIGVNMDTPGEAPLGGMGLRREREILASFGDRYRALAHDWRSQLGDIGFERCALWGAGAKGVAFLNAIDPQAQFGAQFGPVIDLSPWKWDRYLPVTAHQISEPTSRALHGIDNVIITNPAYHNEIAGR